MNQPYTLPPDLQRLIDAPFNEPPVRARQHWKRLDTAMRRLDDTHAQQARYDTRGPSPPRGARAPQASTSFWALGLTQANRNPPPSAG